MGIFGLHKREFFLHLDFIKTYLNIDSANIYTTLTAPFSPNQNLFSYHNNGEADGKQHEHW